MKNFFKILFSNTKLDLSCAYSATKSIKKILAQEKASNKFKVIIALIGVVTTFVAAIYCGIKETESVIGSAFSLLIAAIAIDDSTNSKISLLSSIELKISEVSNEDLKKQYLDLFFKIVEAQSFVK